MRNQIIGQLKSRRLSDYKLIVLDMDGTLLNSDGGLSKDTIAFLNQEKLHPYEIMFATGRMPLAVINILKKLEISKVVISHNGAQISNLDTEEVYYSSHLSESTIRVILEIHQSLGIPLHLNLVDKVVTDKTTSLTQKYARELGIKITVKSDFGPILTDEVVSALFLGSKKQLSEALKKIQSETTDFSHVLIPSTDSEAWMLQFLPKETSKGKGVIEYAKSRKISLNSIIAFGDNYNDLEMLTSVGLGIAMGNAQEQLKEKADVTTLSNDDDGVIYALDLLLSSQGEN